MSYKQVTIEGFRMVVKAEVTSDTKLYRYGDGIYVVCTEVGRKQFEKGDYAPNPLNRFEIPWSWVPQDVKDKAARVSDWCRVRLVGREWNFVGFAK